MGWSSWPDDPAAEWTCCGDALAPARKKKPGPRKKKKRPRIVRGPGFLKEDRGKSPATRARALENA